LTIADKSYPRKLAFSYLDELSKEFSTTYGPKVEGVRKPYAFVGFGAQLRSLLLGGTSPHPFHRHIHVENSTSIQRHTDSECSRWFKP
jgi:hypothetical protein